MRIAHPDVSQETRSRTRTLTARLASLKPSRHDQIDAAFVMGLLVVAFSGFVTSFDSPQLWVVIGVGLLTGLVTAHVAITWEWPWGVVVVVCVLWYFLLGTPLALPEEAIGRMIPSSRSLTILATLPISGWKGMLTTLPPLASRGTYAALVLLLALLSSALSYLIARRALRPAVALAVPLLTAGLVIVLGTLDAFHPRVQGVLLALLSFGWMANRFPRRRRLLSVQKLRRSSAVLGAGMLVAGAVGGMLLGPVLPGTVGKPRLVARSYVQPPIDMRDYVSPLVGFRKYSSKELDLYYDTPMLEIEGLEPRTWVRFAALDSYNGHVWSATGDVSDPNTGFLRLGSRVPSPPLEGLREATITVLDGYASNTDLNAWVPGLGRVAALKFGGLFSREHAAALRFNLSTQQALLPDRLKSKDTIRLSAAPLRTFDQLPAEIRPGEARRLPDQASDFLSSLAQTNGGDQPTPLARLRSAAEKLRAGAWSDGSRSGEKHFLPGHGRFRLAAFASGRELVGSDEQYAAVFALIANRYGFPARVAFGALTPEEGPIRGKDIKAWVEIQVESGEWVTVPTDTFTPERSKQPSDSPQPAKDQSSSTNVPPPNPGRPPGSYGDMFDTDPASGRIARKDAPAGNPLLAIALWVGVPIGGLGLIAAVILVAKAVRSSRRRGKGETWLRVANGWRDLLDHACDSGIAVPRGLTRMEQSRLLGDSAASLAADADAAVFGGEHITSEQVRDYWKQLKGARAELSAGLPWWRRPLARVSLRSFLPQGASGRKPRD